MNTLMMCTLTRNNYIKIVCGCNTLFCRPARLRGSDYFFLITQSFRLLCDTPRQGASLHWANTLSPAQVRAFELRSPSVRHTDRQITLWRVFRDSQCRRMQVTPECSEAGLILIAALGFTAEGRERCLNL